MSTCHTWVAVAGLLVIGQDVLSAQTPRPLRRARSVEEVAATALDAVVTLRCLSAAGRPEGVGSGFIVTGGRIVTNAHVVRGCARIEVHDRNGDLLLTTPFAEAYSASVDVAVLPVVPSARHSLALATRSPNVGQRIVVIGAPEGLTHTVSDGLISAIRTAEEGRLLQFTAPVSHGSSGGPILTLDGLVVGITVAQIREGQNLNFGIPAGTVRALLDSPADRIAFSSIPTLYSDSSDRVKAPPPTRAAARRDSTPPLERAPVASQLYRHFRVDLLICAMTQGSLVCVVDVTNTAADDRPNNHFHFDAVYAVSDHGTTSEADEVDFGGRVFRTRGWADFANQRIRFGTRLRMAVAFGPEITGARSADIHLRVQVGGTGSVESVWFRSVSVEQR